MDQSNAEYRRKQYLIIIGLANEIWDRIPADNLKAITTVALILQTCYNRIDDCNKLLNHN